MFYWADKTYDVRVDDITQVREASFTADGFDRIGLYIYRRGTVWFDEIFAGTDTSMHFQCPTIKSSGVVIDRPDQHSWPLSEIGGYSYNHPMTRWISHIASREEYNYNNGGLVPMDGEAHTLYLSDINKRYGTGDKRVKEGSILAGVLTHLEGNTPMRNLQSASLTKVSAEDYFTAGEYTANETVGQTGVYLWYGEHDYPQGISAFQGGIGACSTTDFVTWKFEGIMLHYANITDMVYGTDGPFIVERPKVLYNSKTSKYVMWMSVDNKDYTLGLAGIAISDYRDGPYDFIRTFYPDGNETRDQMVFQDEFGNAYLARTFYQNVEYILPDRVMQPIWEGVRDGNGDIDFPLNYHRAQYEHDYDDYHDIYLQRWRAEDSAWNVTCVNRVTGASRDIPRGTTTDQGTWCIAPFEYKVIRGLGWPYIPSRYSDPFDEDNNQWTPESVPGVQAQPWKNNYQDGFCGIHKTNDGYDPLDPELELPSRSVPYRGDCSNIADNQPHEVRPDQLIGEANVVNIRRSKYVAISKLTEDYLDTTGIVTYFEGELEDEEYLMSLITQLGQYRWGTNDEVGTTYMPQEIPQEFTMADDWDIRFHQFEEQYNDRSQYALACVLDGTCSVNFKDQLT